MIQNHDFICRPLMFWYSSISLGKCFESSSTRSDLKFLYASILPFTCWFFSSAFSRQSLVYSWGFLPWSMYLLPEKKKLLIYQPLRGEMGSTNTVLPKVSAQPHSLYGQTCPSRISMPSSVTLLNSGDKGKTCFCCHISLTFFGFNYNQSKRIISFPVVSISMRL